MQTVTLMRTRAAAAAESVLKANWGQDAPTPSQDEGADPESVSGAAWAGKASELTHALSAYVRCSSEPFAVLSNVTETLLPEVPERGGNVALTDAVPGYPSLCGATFSTWYRYAATMFLQWSHFFWYYTFLRVRVCILYCQWRVDRKKNAASLPEVPGCVSVGLIVTMIRMLWLLMRGVCQIILCCIPGKAFTVKDQASSLAPAACPGPEAATYAIPLAAP